MGFVIFTGVVEVISPFYGGNKSRKNELGGSFVNENMQRLLQVF